MFCDFRHATKPEKYYQCVFAVVGEQFFFPVIEQFTRGYRLKCLNYHHSSINVAEGRQSQKRMTNISARIDA
jgi:hypothetical protein